MENFGAGRRQGKAAEVTWDDDTIYLKLQQTNQKTLFSAMPEVTYYTGKAQSDDALTAYLKEYKVASYGKDVPDSSGLILTMILTMCFRLSLCGCF